MNGNSNAGEKKVVFRRFKIINDKIVEDAESSALIGKNKGLSCSHLLIQDDTLILYNSTTSYISRFSIDGNEDLVQLRDVILLAVADFTCPIDSW